MAVVTDWGNTLIQQNPKNESVAISQHLLVQCVLALNG